MSLNLFCPMNQSTGYGITSTNIAYCLSKHTANCSLFPIGPHVTVEKPEQKDIVLDMLENAKRYNSKNPCLKIWHQHDLSTRIGTGHYYVMPFFEADKLKRFEVHQINQADFVFNPTKWGKRILEENGVNKPIYVCPLGVDLDIFNPASIRVENPKYTFLHIGKWEKRKSQDFLLKAFEAAFEPTDDVHLNLLPHNPFLSEQEIRQWLSLVEKNKMSNNISVYNRLPRQIDVASMISHADCGIFLSRAEGWNNEIPEMMAMDKPIIATNYSAHTEYCTKENSFLVEIEETEPAKDDKWFDGYGNWAKLGEKQLEQTVEHMRFVYNNNVRTNPNGVETAKLYTWDNTASVIHQTLLENNSYNANT